MPTRSVTASQNISEDRNIKWPGGVCRSVPSITPYTGLEWWTTASRHVTGRWDLGGKWFGKCWIYLGLCKHAGPEFLFFWLVNITAQQKQSFFFFFYPRVGFCVNFIITGFVSDSMKIERKKRCFCISVDKTVCTTLCTRQDCKIINLFTFKIHCKDVFSKILYFIYFLYILLIYIYIFNIYLYIQI